MKNFIFVSLCLVFFSCGNSKESPEDIAGKWCELNKRIMQAEEEVEHDKLVEEIENFEKNVHDKYGNNDEFMKNLDEAMEKCQDELEGLEK